VLFNCLLLRSRERERELLSGIIGRKVPGVSLGTRCHNNLRFPYSRNKTGTHDLVLVTQMRHYTIFSSQISPEDAHVESGFKCSYQSYSTHTHTHTHNTPSVGPGAVQINTSANSLDIVVYGHIYTNLKDY